MIRTCPVCRIGLVDQKFDGVSFAECPQCAGIWILEEELKRLESVGVDELKRLDGMERPMSVPPPAASSVFACPSCGQAMEQFHFLYNTPIMLHRCQPCGGLWIEDGEMAQMATMIEQGDSVGTNLGVDRAKADEIMARFTQEHEETMARYQSVANVCRALCCWVRPYGFWW